MYVGYSKLSINSGYFSPAMNMAAVGRLDVTQENSPMGRNPIKASLRRANKVQVALTDAELKELEKVMAAGNFPTASDLLREPFRRLATDILKM